MKSLLLAMALLSTPAFAEVREEANAAVSDSVLQDANAELCLGDRNFGVCLGDRRPGWGRPDRRPEYRPVECVAENYRGMRFSGYGRFQQEAARNAADNCYRAGSRRCEIRWCR